MTWDASATTATQLTSITTEQFFSFSGTAYITLNPRERAHIQVEYNPVTTPTDNLVVALYGTLDAITENWDDTPFMEFEIDNAIDPNAVSFIVEGFYKFRIGVRRSGSTDTITSADCKYRKDGVSA